MNEKFKKYGSSNAQTGDDLEVFVGSPEKLNQSIREEMVYRYKYGNETVEYLAIEYRLLPSSLRTWLEQNSVVPVDLSNEDELDKFEKMLEQKKRITAIRFTGSVLNHMNTTWERLAKTEHQILKALDSAIEDVNNAEVVNPKALSSLAKVHTSMTKQLLDNKAAAEEGDNFGSLTNLLSKKLESVFDEIDDLNAI